MSIRHLNPAYEGTAYTVSFSFKDEDGNSVVPNSIAWDLTDPDGNVINGRSGMSVAPAAEVEIMLSGDDLKAVSRDYNVLTLKADYDSAAGSGLPIREECIVPIIDLQNVT